MRRQTGFPLWLLRPERVRIAIEQAEEGLADDPAPDLPEALTFALVFSLLENVVQSGVSSWKPEL